MHIRFRLDVMKSLKRDKVIHTEDSELKIVGFKYERITIFCNLCGTLWHGDANCEELFEMEVGDANCG